MPGFNLANYEPVEDRLARFWDEHPNGRVLTDLVPAPEGQWIIRSEVWRDGAAERPDATGYAHEIVTDRGVNSTSALENCETSSLGRALANLGYAPKGARPSREEMTKASQQRDPIEAKRAQVVEFAKAHYAAPDEFANDFAYLVADPAATVGNATEDQLDVFLKAKETP